MTKKILLWEERWRQAIAKWDSENQPRALFAKTARMFVGTRELFIHWKAMVPYVQLSTNCGMNF